MRKTAITGCVIFTMTVLATCIMLLTGIVDRQALAAAWDPGSPGGTPQYATNCGCPPNSPTLQDVTNAPKGAWRKDSKHPQWAKLPTRCIVENQNPNGTSVYNDYGVKYPDFSYPTGYPGAGGTIPFPGWPKNRGYGNSNWSKGSAAVYKTYYVKTKGGTPPNGANSPKPWENYQIHHILQRNMGGNDAWSNLVPVLSAPAASNQHKHYTNWWRYVTCDSQVPTLAGCP
jgi:hypothetical protein